MSVIIYSVMLLFTSFMVARWLFKSNSHSLETPGDFTFFILLAGLLWPATWVLISMGYIHVLVKEICERG